MKIDAHPNQVEIAAPAKINLFLELTAKRADGFHEIETVMTAVSIFDRLRFTLRDEPASRLSIKFTQQGDRPGEVDKIPSDERNLILKAIQLVRSTAQSEFGSGSCVNGFEVLLQKNIPSAAGLGGASSNAAAALLAANRLWNLNWSIPKLATLAAQLGSDIPFFLYGGTAICRGRGEKIQPMVAPARIPVVIAKPEAALSTAQVFRTVSLTGETRGCESWERGLGHFRAGSFRNRMFNRLQQFAEPLTDQIGRMADEFSRLNCRGHQMSGSGSSYFGVFSNARVASHCARRLSSRLPDVRIFCSHTLGPAAN